MALDVTGNREAADLVSDGRRVLWVGRDAPIAGCVTTEDLMDPACDYRLDSSFHGQFDTVFITEYDLASGSEWPLVVDEAVRALAPAGTLVLRYSVGRALAGHELMTLLHKRSRGQCEELFERRWQGSAERLVAVRMTVPERQASVAGVTFALVTDGSQPDRVREFVESARSIRGLQTIPYEILVCGPVGSEDHVQSDIFRDVRLVEQSSRNVSRGWITNKKNRLVASAQHEIIVVAHDRYMFPPDWLESLMAFGGDFDVVVPRQRTLDGMRYPDWVAVGSDRTLSPLVEMPYAAYSERSYINGGVLIARTQILRDTPWNELLFWGDAEDVELTRRLQATGVVPRPSRRIELVTRLTRADQVSVFERRAQGRVLAVSMDRSDHVAVGVPLQVAGAAGDVLAAEELPSAPEAVLPGPWTPNVYELTLKLGSDVAEISDCLLHLQFGPEHGSEDVVSASVNGQAADVLDVSRVHGAIALVLALDRAALHPQHTLRVRLRSTGVIDLDRLTVTLATTGDRARASTRLGFRAGETRLAPNEWYEPEDWGTWSRGHTATMLVGVVPDGRDAVLRVLARGRVPAGLARQIVAVRIGRRYIGELQLQPTDRWYEVVIPEELTRAGCLRLSFDVLASYAGSGGTGPGDTREIGFGLVAIEAPGALLAPCDRG